MDRIWKWALFSWPALAIARIGGRLQRAQVDAIWATFEAKSTDD